MDVLLVLVEERLYALPLDRVVEVVRTSYLDVKSVKGKRAITVRDRIVPLVWLAQAFGSRSGLRGPQQDRSLDEATKKAIPLLEEVAHDPRVVSMDPQQVLDVLEQLLAVHPFLELAYVANSDGRVVAGPVASKGVQLAKGFNAAGKDWSSRAWFRHTAAGRTYVSEKYISAATDSVCVTVSTPVRSPSGAVIGVIGADVSVSLTKDRLYVVIVSDDGRQIGVVVGEVIGKRDVEVEPLSSAFSGPDLLGAAVLDDSAVAMVVNLQGIIKNAL